MMGKFVCFSLLCAPDPGCLIQTVIMDTVCIFMSNFSSHKLHGLLRASNVAGVAEKLNSQ